MRLRSFSSRDADFDAVLGELLSRMGEPDAEVEREVAAIIRDVRARGDAALIEHTRRLDRRVVEAADLEIPAGKLKEALASLAAPLRTALDTATRRIRAFHEKQKAESWSFEDGEGVVLGQQITPLDRVGVYVPGGRAAYPSSVLMNIIPARVAGVGEIIMTVPAPQGELDPAVLAAAHLAGADRVFSVGGAQAVAALAFGTESIPAVDKITGPGNRWVAAAKRQVFGHVGIDMIAGPSEVVIISDGSSDPEWVALDMLAQAEHDEEARAILICTDAAFITRVESALQHRLRGLERAEIARVSLERNGAVIQAADLTEAAGISNRIAPEHLELAVSEPERLLPRIRHAGAIFLGSYSAEVLGDYCAGPNHVLPTGRSARFASPLGVYDFQKRSSLMKCSPRSGGLLAETASVLARAEGLTAHAQAAECRLPARK